MSIPLDIAILADDLTGAVDSAAAFALPECPVRVTWNGRFDTVRSALDSETRNAGPVELRQAVAGLLPSMRTRATAFKKIDSLLRGNTFEELAACCEATTHFDLVIVAPAFPDQRRVTRDGAQYELDAAGTAIGCQDIVLPLRQRHIAAVVLDSADALPPRGVIVCDAETPADLERVVDRGRAAGASILWCGSAGLAMALAGDGVPSPIAPRPQLAVIGSQHPATRTRLPGLRAQLQDRYLALASDDDVEGVMSALSCVLAQGLPAALVFDLPPIEPAAAERLYRRTFAQLARISAPRAMVVVGGDTLYRLVTALNAAALVALGQWAPGVPMSRVEGGAWSDSVVFSKSGAFDDLGLFSMLVGEAK